MAEPQKPPKEAKALEPFVYPIVVRRPLLGLFGAFVLGIWLGPTAYIAELGFVFAILTLLVVIGLHYGSVLSLLLCGIWGLCAGALYGGLHRPRSPENPAPRDTVLFEGIVQELRIQGNERQVLVLELLGSAEDYRMRLRPRRGRVFVTVQARNPSPEPQSDCGRIGERIRIWGKLKRPSSILMPGFEKSPPTMTYYASIPSGDYCLRLEEKKGAKWEDSFQTARVLLGQVLYANTSTASRGLLHALTTGQRHGLSPELRTDFQRSGLAHLLAVSGLHLSVAIGLVYSLLVFLFGRSALVINSLGKQRLSALLCIPILIFYTGLVGSSSSATRAGFMLLLLLLARVLVRTFDPWTALGVAGLGMLGYRPRLLFDIGAQLSFGAVIALLTIYPALRRAFDGALRGRFFMLFHTPLELFLVGLAASLGTLPIVAWHFHWLPFAGLFSNIVATPLTAIFILPFSLAGGGLGLVFPSFGKLLLLVADFGAEALIALAHWSASVSWSGVYCPKPTLFECVLFYAALYSLCFRNALGAKRLLPCVCLVALFAAVVHETQKQQTQGRTKVSVLDVGQGDAILIQFPDESTVLIDTGASFHDYSTAARVIAPFLRTLRIRKLDAIIITHSDNDHAGGLPVLRAQFEVGKVYWNGNPQAERSLLLALDAFPSTQILNCGDGLQFGEAFLEVLHPCSRMEQESDWSKNDYSLTVRIRHGSRRFLFVGDLEAKGEKSLLDNRLESLPADVLKVGHHGSNTSSGPEFLKAVRPAHAVISAGKQNRFGLPHPQVLRRLGERGAQIWRTDVNGLIQFETDGVTLRVKTFR